MFITLLTSFSNNILTVTINRPEKLNALNHVVINELNLLLDHIATNDEIKSVIITGSGTKAFVAGADISEFNGLSIKEGNEVAKKGQETFFRIENNAKPFVACVNGFALGGGCELAMSCHIRIASTSAKFGQPEINLGLIPGYGGTQRLVHLIGKGRALEMMLSAKMIDASTALQYGLVNNVVAQEDLLNTATELLTTINTKPTLAIAACIIAANAAEFTPDKGYQTELHQFAHCFGTQDMKEGVNAFLEKRKPIFVGK